MTECLRYSVGAPARSRALRHDGRWARILRVLADGPMSQSRIYALTDPGKYRRSVETLKIFSALRDMHALGWIDHHPARGWSRTALGAAALEQAELSPPRSHRSKAHD